MTEQTRIVTHHDLAKRSSSEHIEDLVLLLLREAGGLRKDGIRKVRDFGHG